MDLRIDNISNVLLTVKNLREKGRKKKKRTKDGEEKEHRSSMSYRPSQNECA